MVVKAGAFWSSRLFAESTWILGWNAIGTVVTLKTLPFPKLE